VVAIERVVKVIDVSDQVDLKPASILFLAENWLELLIKEFISPLLFDLLLIHLGNLSKEI